MRKLDHPEYKVKDVINAYNSSRANIFENIDIDALQKHLTECEDKYIILANNEELHSISNNECTGQELVPYLYEKFLKQKNLKIIYDKIKLSPKNSECPYCGCVKGSNLTLDHYLAKSLFSEYSVTPLNLVPSCNHCNTSKSDKRFNNKEEQVLHPYFDDYSDAQWIYAKFVEEKSFIFYCNPPKEWDSIKKERLKSHFKTFKLAENYAPMAAQEISEVHLEYKTIFFNEGTEKLTEKITERFNSLRSLNVNSWKTALYQLLATTPNCYRKVFC